MVDIGQVLTDDQMDEYREVQERGASRRLTVAARIGTAILCAPLVWALYEAVTRNL